HPSAALDDERAVDAVAATEAAPPFGSGRGDLGRRQHARSAHQPGHARTLPYRRNGGQTLAVPIRSEGRRPSTVRRTTIEGGFVAGSVLGNRVIRKEDPKFITTGGVYVGDLHDVPELDGAAFVAYVRSSVAHGIVTAIDADD